MRKFLMVAAMVAGVQGAQAADMPALRGSYNDIGAVRPNWDGFYVGGQASYGANDMDFADSAQDLAARLLNNVDLEQQFSISKWPLGGKSSQRNSGFGGFAGYNTQFEDVVIGLEGSYIHGQFFGQSAGQQTRNFFYPTDYFTTASLASSSSMKIKDYGTFRIRGGYSYGNFLFYGFGGAAFGRADIVRQASYASYYLYTGSANPALPNIGPTFQSLAENGKDHFVYGYAAGAGIDMMLLENLFLRAEYEWLRFTSPIDTTISSVRVGLGYKF
jgi:opacity protein-like surface antigen